MGLTVNSEYIACGSEKNEVFVYHKVCVYSSYTSCVVHMCRLTDLGVLQAISKPAAWHEFGSDADDGEEEAAVGSYFISAVCWKSDSPTMVTANSEGTIKVLVLAP